MSIHSGSHLGGIRPLTSAAPRTFRMDDLLDETRRVSTQHERWAEELYSAPTAATGAVSKRANVWGREFAKAKGRVGPAMRVSGVVQGPARVEGGEKWAQEYLAEEVPASATTHEVKELQDVADSLFGGLILNELLSIFLSWLNC